MKRFLFGLWLLLIASSVQAHRAGPNYVRIKPGNGIILAQGSASVTTRGGKIFVVSRGTIRLLPAPFPRGFRFVEPLKPRR